MFCSPYFRSDIILLSQNDNFSGGGSVTDFQAQMPCLSQKGYNIQLDFILLKITIMIALVKLKTIVYTGTS